MEIYGFASLSRCCINWQRSMWCTFNGFSDRIARCNRAASNESCIGLCHDALVNLVAVVVGFSWSPCPNRNRHNLVEDSGSIWTRNKFELPRRHMAVTIALFQRKKLACSTKMVQKLGTNMSSLLTQLESDSICRITFEMKTRVARSTTMNNSRCYNVTSKTQQQ
jgi:hypothetical protein